MTEPKQSPRQNIGTLQVILIYACFASAWIVFSDLAVAALISDPENQALASIFKGWAFVAVTTALLYGLLRKGENAPTKPKPWAGGHLPDWVHYAFAITISTVTLLICSKIAVSFSHRPLLIIMMFPIVLSAALGGFGPGLIATLITALGINYFAILPLHSFAIAENDDLLQWMFLIVNGLLVSILAELAWRSRDQAYCALQELSETLSLLENITDSSSEVIFAKDMKDRFILINRAACQRAGKPAEALLGHDERAIFPAEQADRLMATNQQVLAENRTITQKVSISLPDGDKDFLTTKGPLRNKQDETIGLYCIAQDITDSERFTKALETSEAQYRNLFDNMINGYAYCQMLYDEHGEAQDFIYLQVNPAFEAMTGLKDVTGRKVSDIIPGIRTTEPALFAIYARIAKGGMPEHFETYIEALQMWFQISVYCPKPAHFVALFDVITERKANEAALRQQTEELAQRNAELQRFNRVMVGRELDMIELKKQINALHCQLGLEPPYPLAFLDTSAVPPQETHKE